MIIVPKTLGRPCHCVVWNPSDNRLVKYIRTQIHVHMYVHIYIHLYMHTYNLYIQCINVCMWNCVCTYIRNIHACIHIYILTYIHIYFYIVS